MSFEKIIRLGLGLVLLFGAVLYYDEEANGQVKRTPQPAARRVRKSKKARRHKVKVSPAARQTDGTSLLPGGVWGGEHIKLDVHDTGAGFEFDCAHSTVSKPITLDGRNHFEAEGVYIREHGGPERPGQAPDSHPVRYAGRVEGDEMTVTVTLTDINRTIGTFTLVRGAAPMLMKCM